MSAEQHATTQETGLQFDAGALDMLSDEERAAINESEFSPEEIAALTAVAGEGDDDDDDDDVAGAAGAEGGAPATAAPAATAPAAEEAAAAETAAPQPRAPTYEAPLPEDYQQRVDALKSETDSLAQKFRNGDIDFEEFQIESAKLTEQREDLLLLRAKAEISQDMSGQTAATTWQNQIIGFFEATKSAGGIDYMTDAAKQADLDQFVKVLASNDANNDKDGPWFLAEAHKRVMALHGLTGQPQPNPAPAPGAKPNAQPAPRKPEKGEIPQTLAHVPGGTGPGDVSSEFAELDGLEGLELETALARMSDEQRARYAAG